MVIIGFLMGVFLSTGVHETLEFSHCKESHSAQYCKDHGSFDLK